jgi:monothiol glutaredoxin
MGIRKRIRRKLAILGGQTPDRTPTPPAPVRHWEPEPEPESPRGTQEPAAYIEDVVKANPVTLFMKGTATAPQCGFSASAAAILSSYGADLHTIDVTIDPEVREQVKLHSSWPTLPQVYIGGDFVGGADILSQLHESGELKALIESATG